MKFSVKNWPSDGFGAITTIVIKNNYYPHFMEKISFTNITYLCKAI